MDTEHLYAVVMAGGPGTRFWPEGRENKPKQLLNLLGGKTMVEETVQRLFPLIAPERIFVITGRKYTDRIRPLLPIPEENVIGEPESRSTAPCAALAAALIGRKDADSTIILLPADHEIRPVKLFQNTLLEAAEQAQSGDLVTIGITPGYPATGYGYIRPGPQVRSIFSRAEEFREKPDRATADLFFRSGAYLWNSGILICRRDALSAAFARYAPDLSGKLENWAGGADFSIDFADCRKISIDRAILEKADRVLVAAAPFFWNDMGSWSSLRSVLPLDENGNAVKGNVVQIDSGNNVLVSDDGTLLGVIGIRDTAVVKSGNGILVCPLSEEQRVKELVSRIPDEKFK